MNRPNTSTCGPRQTACSRRFSIGIPIARGIWAYSKRLWIVIPFLAGMGTGLGAFPMDLQKDWKLLIHVDPNDTSASWIDLPRLPLATLSAEERNGAVFCTLHKEVHWDYSEWGKQGFPDASLHIPHIGSYYEIYWNEELLARGGEREEMEILRHTQRRHLILPIPRDRIFPGSNRIRILLGAQPGYFFDIWAQMHSVPIAIDSHTRLMEANSERWTLMLIFLYFFMGIYHLLFYAKRPQEEYNLYYGFFSLLLSVYLYTRTNAVYELGLDTIVLKRIEFAVVFMVPLFLVFFLDRYFLGSITRAGKIYGGLAIGLLVVPAILGSGAWLNRLLFYWQITVFYVLFHVLYVCYVAFRRNLPDIRNLFLGISVVMVCSVWDVLGALGYFGFANQGMMRYGFFVFVVGIAFLLANRFLRVHTEVEELNADLEKKVEERTLELTKTLGEVQDLKIQQDGDYFLTSLLIQPLCQNAIGSSLGDIDIHCYTKQKKSFEFRGKKLDIGGDINIVDRLNLHGRDYIAFVNGDAMGKSIQGAGGALVLGVMFHSVLNRTNRRKIGISKGPEFWLQDCYLELQSVFETFDGSMLVSVLLGLLDVKSGYLFYVNSEHPWTVLLRNGSARFIDSGLELRKLGTLGVDIDLKIRTFLLEPGDQIFIGSDGRDDIIMGRTPGGERIINEDENLFLQSIESSNGDLDGIVADIERRGELSDDLSLVRIAFHPDSKLVSVYRAEETERYHNLMRIGRQNLDNLDYVQASVQFTMLADEFPRYVEPLYYASLSYRNRKSYREAIEYGERLYLRDREHRDNLHNLVELYRLVGNFEKADRIQKLLG